MKLDYGTQLSPLPVKLSIGSIRKPTLRDIAELSFEKFTYYEFLARLKPEQYYTEINGEEGKLYLDSLDEGTRQSLNFFSIFQEDDDLKEAYIELLNYFFVENVIFKEGIIIILKDGIEDIDETNIEKLQGVITKETLPQVLEIIQQICCIYSEEEKIENIKFKNKIARQMYEKMQKAQREKKKKLDLNLTIPNIISALSNKHPSLNYLNIWDLTVFQLFDAFSRVQVNSIFDIDSNRVSVWGDEKKTFDPSLWFKNEYDKKSVI